MVDYANIFVRMFRRALTSPGDRFLAPAHGGPGGSVGAERSGTVIERRARYGPLSRAAGFGGAAVVLVGVLVTFATPNRAPVIQEASSGIASDSSGTPTWYRPPPVAERWAPELHSVDGTTYTPTFTPDLRTAYFVLWNAQDFNDPSSIQELYTARWSDADSAWTPRERVAVTAGWRMDWPHVSPDGSRLFFSYIRPHPGHYGYADGRSLPPRTGDFDLWSVQLDPDGVPDGATLAPLRSPDLNRPKTPENARIGYVHNETAPRTDRAGRLYFWTERLDDGGGRRDVYLAEPDAPGPDGEPRWREPELLPFNTAARESGVAVDPDGRWVIFASEGRGGFGKSDLFVVVRDGDGWTEPVNLGPEVNTRRSEDSPEVSPDGGALFFSTPRPGPGVPTVTSPDGSAGVPSSVYWIDLDAVPAFVRAVGPSAPVDDA